VIAVGEILVPLRIVKKEPFGIYLIGLTIESSGTHDSLAFRHDVLLESFKPARKVPRRIPWS
jgi:hypothetical protein